MKRQIIMYSQVPKANHKGKGYRRKMRGYRRSDKLLQLDSSRRSDRQSAAEANHVADLHAQREYRCARWTRGPCFLRSSPQFGHKVRLVLMGKHHRRRKGAVPYTANRIYGSIKTGKIPRPGDCSTLSMLFNCVYPQEERERGFLDTGLEIGKEQGK